MEYKVYGRVYESIEAPSQKEAIRIFKEEYPEALHVYSDTQDPEPIPTFDPTFKYPEYAKVLHTCMCHNSNGVYYREAGRWELQTKVVDGKLLVAKCANPGLIGLPLVKITNKEWRKDNAGYLK